MADYRVLETASFLEDLAAAFDRARLTAKLHGYVYPLLRVSPRHHPQSRLIQGASPITWRWRIGDWRIFYQIDEASKTVFIIALDLRRDAYR